MKAMDLSNVLKLWDSWNIRAFIILSLLIQAFLILFAPLRKRVGGKWGKCVRMMIWSVYLLADWIAGLAIGSILSNQKKKPANSSDVQAFWAPFLLLHLGGPDTITSFALEDNEFWVRHLLGMALQVGSTVYVFIMSLPDNKLWLPTVLVLTAGIIKYVERNRAFYLASFDQFGDNWVPIEWAAGLPIPVQFKNLGTADCLPIKLMESNIDSAPLSSVDNDIDQYFADSDPKSILQATVYLFGTIRRPLHSYFLSKSQLMKSFANFGSKKMDSSAKDALQKMEIELSLLYEVLHTKFPVVVSKIGYISRGVNFGCILGAILSFSLVKKQYELEAFDACLTYGLLIGALALDFISIILIVSSDWFFVANFHNNGSNRFVHDGGFINRRRWSKAVPQLNFITYSAKDHPNWMKKLATFLPVRSLLEAMKGIQCLSSQNFREDLHWRFIFDQVMSFLKREPAGVLEEDWFQRSKRNLQACLIDKDVERIIKESDYTQSLLTWHIATELCIREEDAQSTSSGIGSTDDHKAICKLLSDYMFYLLILEPAMMSPVLNNWKKVFDDTYEDTLLILGGQSIASNEKNASRQILSTEFDNHKREDLNGSVLPAARDLAIQLRQSYGYPWKRMSRIWVHLMGHAASNCRPNVRAQQPSKGGELLTFIWLCITNFGDRLLSNRMTKISLTDYL